MNAPYTGSGRIGDSALATRLRKELKGEILFDPASRGRYSTDASIYQIEPIGVVVPLDEADVVRAIQIAADERISILPRGGGTSQCGQTVGEALVLDVSKNLAAIAVLGGVKRPILVVETAYWAFSVAVTALPPKVDVPPAPSTTGVVARVMV